MMDRYLSPKFGINQSVVSEKTMSTDDGRRTDGRTMTDDGRPCDDSSSAVQ